MFPAETQRATDTGKQTQTWIAIRNHYFLLTPRTGLPNRITNFLNSILYFKKHKKYPKEFYQ